LSQVEAEVSRQKANMTHRIKVLAVGFVLGLVGIGGAAWWWPVSREEQVVFLAVLKQGHFEATPQAITRRTALDELANSRSLEAGFYKWCFRRATISPELVEEFKRKNRFQATIPFNFSKASRIPITDVHEPLEELSRWASRDPYAASCTRKCSNHIRFSRVGFSTPRDTALVAVDFHCPICSYNGFFLAKKNESAWRLVDQCAVLVS